jgi:tetratricopeptide (TPR) repeat protein/predicted Ser/Thr protein kinase
MNEGKAQQAMPSGTKCPQCGAAVVAGPLDGLCPACLLKQGVTAETATQSEAAPFVPPSVEEMRRLFPQLEILEFIGQGGMGAVYKARQPVLDRLVALKILPSQTASGPGFVERFNREARTLAKLIHSNIVAVHQFGQIDALSFFIMEYVDGLNLRQLEQAGRLAPPEALQIIPQICEALQFAHDEGVVHRDIKPENILLDKKGRVKIADFGIAKIMGPEPGGMTTETKQAIGTPHYMAPEQLEKPELVDHRADIFSLGVVFYEMLTGELPLGKFAPPSRQVEVDVRLDEVVLRALEKEPDRRYQQASVLKTEVETIALSQAQRQDTQKKENNMTVQTSKTSATKFVIVTLSLFVALVVLVIAAAVAWYFVARAPGGNATQLAQQGWQLWQAQRLDEAIAKFNEAIKLAPNDANIWNGLGWATFNSGKSAEAERAFQKVLSLQPNHPAALNGLGQIYLSQRKYDLAENYLLQAAPQAPAAWYGLARLYLIQGKFEPAEEWACKVVDSGQADDFARKMLEAAQAKKLSDGLRFMLEPPTQ